MIGVKKFRQDNLIKLAQGFEGKKKEFAERAGLSAAYAYQLMDGRREMGDEVARRIEANFGLDAGSLDLPSRSINEGVTVYETKVIKLPLYDWGEDVHASSAKQIYVSSRFSPADLVLSADTPTPLSQELGLDVSLYVLSRRQHVDGDTVIASKNRQKLVCAYHNDLGNEYLTKAGSPSIPLGDDIDILGVVTGIEARR